MRRVVITGLGIVSCIGNNKTEVLDSLLNTKSGIVFSEEHKKYNFRSQVVGSVKNLDLDKGDWRIIGLGTGAAFLVRTGVGVLIDEDGGNSSLILNMIALNTGWYYTFKKVSKNKTSLSYIKSNKHTSSITISPIIMNLSKNPIPGMQIQPTFY